MRLQIVAYNIYLILGIWAQINDLLPLKNISEFQPEFHIIYFQIFNNAKGK